MKKKDIILNGLIRQNPIFKLVLGTCPTLALTTALSNGIGMGLAVTFVFRCCAKLFRIRSAFPHSFWSLQLSLR